MLAMDSRKRNPNWTLFEKEFAIAEIINRSDELFGKFRGASNGAKQKEQCWQEIANVLNSYGRTSCIRSVAELKKLYYNCKGKTKEKMDATKMTGGGSKPVMNQCEDLIVQHWVKNGSAEATGVDGGLESVVNTVEVSDTQEEDEMTSSLPVDIQLSPLITTPVPLIQSTSTYTKSSSKTSKRKRDEQESELYNLEKQRIIAETDKFNSESLYWKNKIKLETELHHLKKSMLLKQIGSENDIEDE